MSRAGLIVGSVLCVLGACRPSGPSVAPPPPPTASAPPEPAPVQWERFAEALAWPLASESPTISLGHGAGDLSVEVRTDPDSLTAYRELGPDTVLTPGSGVLAAHRTASGQPGPNLAMLKAADGTWAFVAANARGYLDPTADLALCARCHAEAPADSLFGLPHPPGAPGAADSGPQNAKPGGEAQPGLEKSFASETKEKP